MKNVKNIAIIVVLATILAGCAKNRKKDATATTTAIDLSLNKIITLSAKDIEALTKSQIQALTGNHIHLLSPLHIKALKIQQVAYFTKAQIPYFSYKQIQALTDGQIQALTKPQIHALTKIQWQYFPVGRFSDEQIMLLDTFKHVHFLTPKQMRQLSVSKLMLLGGKAFRKEQIQSLVVQSKAFTHPSEHLPSSFFTPASVVSYLTPQQIPNVDVANFTNAQIQALTPQQIPYLTSNQVSSIKMTNLIGIQMQALTPLQLRSLTKQQIQTLTKEHIDYYLKPNQVQALKAEQISYLTPKQISYLTLNQIQSISIKSFKELPKDQILSFNINHLTDNQLRFLLEYYQKALTVKQIQSIDLNNLESVYDVLSSSTLNVLTNKQVEYIMPFVSELSMFVIPDLSLQFIRQIPPNKLSLLREDFWFHWEEKQIQALTDEQVKHLPSEFFASERKKYLFLTAQQMSLLDPIRQIAYIPTFVVKPVVDYGYFLRIDQYHTLKKNVQALTGEQVKYLPLPFFTNWKTHLLTPHQISLLNFKTQISYIPLGEISYLSSEQKKALNKIRSQYKQEISFNLIEQLTLEEKNNQIEKDEKPIHDAKP